MPDEIVTVVMKNKIHTSDSMTKQKKVLAVQDGKGEGTFPDNFLYFCNQPMPMIKICQISAGVSNIISKYSIFLKTSKIYK